MDPPGVEPAEGGGGGVRIKWLNHLKGTFRCDKSLRDQNDCPQYIPKGKQTPASKLAFVKNCPPSVPPHGWDKHSVLFPHRQWFLLSRRRLVLQFEVESLSGFFLNLKTKN